MNLNPSKVDFWSRWAAFLFVGYCLFGRSFAYIGLPPAKLFIGEASLAAYLLFQTRYVYRRWFGALTANIPFSAFSWFLLLSVFYGVVELVRGVLAGFSPLTAVENLVFNLYPLYIFLGIYAGTRHPDLMRKCIRAIAWGVCIYGPLYLAVLNRLKWLMPGSSEVPLFPQAGCGSLVLLGLFSFESKLKKYWLPISVGAFMILAMQIRAEWLGFGLSITIWGYLTGRLNRVFAMAGAVLALLILGFVTDITIPSSVGRGGAISSREIVARAVSSVDQDLAAEYSSTKNVQFYYGTIYWRTRWWKQIWDSSNDNPTTFLVGPGYGYPLKELVTYLQKEEIRTPHNVFYFALGYSGWIGVILFFGLQCCLFQLLWRTYKITGQPFGIAVWASTVAGAFFGNCFETPFGAIPSYLMAGMLIAPGLKNVTEIAFRPRFASSSRVRATPEMAGANLA
jgi:hypothetical protein